jgi:carotenoid cleavage dioxygenase
MPRFDPATHPFLNGIFAPIHRELDETPVEVIAGALPRDLSGTYLRNGPNCRFTPIGSYTYPLDGDGMVHAVHIHDGRATYRNRFVRTPAMAAEEKAGRALWGGLLTPIMPSADEVGPDLAGTYKDLPDVNVIRHAGRLLALAESARPFLLRDDLDTVGPWYFGGALPKGLTAHPKLDHASGELVAFRYDFEAPLLTWSVIGADGSVVRAEQSVEIDATYMIHDYVITQRFLVLFVCPARFELSGTPSLRWEPERGTRIAVIARDGSAAPRWIATEAFWVWHFANAFEEIDDRGGTTIVVDFSRWSQLAMGEEKAPATGAVTRARLDPAAGTARFDTLDERITEFPRIDDRLTGQPHRYFYAAAKDGTAGPGTWNALCRYDTLTGRVTTRACGATMIGEPIFAPSTQGAEDDIGYVLTYVFEGERTSLLVLHASDIAAEPAAVLRLPQRVPFGLHGCWVAGAG